MELNEKLCSLRKEKRMSQQELAEALNVSRQAVSRWETGVSVPSMENLLALSRAFGVSVNEFINGDALKPGKEKEEKKAKEPISHRPLRNVFLMILAVAVTVAMIEIVCFARKRAEPVNQNVVRFQELEDERVYDSDIVVSEP